MRRFITFDFIRGIAILAIIVFHRITWDYLVPTREISGSDQISDIEGLFLLILSMAGLFYVVSGTVNAHVTYRRLSSGRNTPRQIILGGWVSGLALIIVSYLFKILFLRATTEQTAIITHFVLTGEFQGLDLATLCHVGTLGMIGTTVIFISTILGSLLRERDFENPRRIHFILAIVGVVILAVTPFLQQAIGPSVLRAIDDQNWGYVFFTSPLIHLYFPVFPYLAYGCFGAIVGIALGREESPKMIKRGVFAMAMTFFLYGILNFKGYVFQADYASMDTLLNQLARQIMQLGIFFFLIWLGLSLFDFRPQETRKKWVRTIRWVNELGRNSLTVFVFEGFLSAVLIRLVRPIWPTYNASLRNAALFGLICLGCWIVILKLWKRVGYRGTTEWCLAYIVKIFSGKQSTRFNPRAG